MFGIINEDKRFILLDDDREKLRVTALMLAKETTAVVQEFDEGGNRTGEHTETKYVPMFDEDTVDDAIKEYGIDDVEKAYTGDTYLKGYAPVRPEEEIAAEKREKRNALLTDSDKYMMPDFPISDEEREKYKAYRTYLRDLPTSDLFPNIDVLTFEQWSK